MLRPAHTHDEIRIRRAEILDSAEALFREQGLDAVSFRQIAAKDGCSQATPYRYFSSKAHGVLNLRIRADDFGLARAKGEVLGVCRDAFEQVETSGGLTLRKDLPTAAHLFWAAAHGADSLHMGGQLVFERSLEDIVPTLITTLMEGVTGGGESG